MIRQGFAVIARTGPACKTQKPWSESKELPFRLVPKRESFPKSLACCFSSYDATEPGLALSFHSKHAVVHARSARFIQILTAGHAPLLLVGR